MTTPVGVAINAVYVAAVVAAFALWPVATALVFEGAGIVAFAWLSWKLHTYSGSGPDPFDSKED